MPFGDDVEEAVAVAIDVKACGLEVRVDFHRQDDSGDDAIGVVGAVGDAVVVQVDDRAVTGFEHVADVTADLTR